VVTARLYQYFRRAKRGIETPESQSFEADRDHRPFATTTGRLACSSGLRKSEGHEKVNSLV
jgi:hypothetical protein